MIIVCSWYTLRGSVELPLSRKPRYHSNSRFVHGLSWRSCSASLCTSCILTLDATHVKPCNCRIVDTEHGGFAWVESSVETREREYGSCRSLHCRQLWERWTVALGPRPSMVSSDPGSDSDVPKSFSLTQAKKNCSLGTKCCRAKKARRGRKWCGQ